MKNKAVLEIDEIRMRAWAHPEGETIERLESRLRDKGYRILEVGVCPHNGREGLLLADVRDS